ncbi:hypothetical protein O4215_20595 [Rhodococcus maanshanensis]|uniref:hypothetical protein n=1 Tax=Rhodococcus maanshanensis TaxID=183556 RepID=UPI0022B4D804|nr:hypothetical protein [Rhodococcus maanshanensis]MCZ4557964.1 hypothetical protein [Rhodococcus maanshanensis]
MTTTTAGKLGPEHARHSLRVLTDSLVPPRDRGRRFQIHTVTPKAGHVVLDVTSAGQRRPLILPNTTEVEIAA